VANIKIFLHSHVLYLLYQTYAQRPEIILSHIVRYRFELRIVYSYLTLHICSW